MGGIQHFHNQIEINSFWSNKADATLTQANTFSLQPVPMGRHARGTLHRAASPEISGRPSIEIRMRLVAGFSQRPTGHCKDFLMLPAEKTRSDVLVEKNWVAIGIEQEKAGWTLRVFVCLAGKLHALFFKMTL
jgi:hypothetical protein